MKKATKSACQPATRWLGAVDAYPPLLLGSEYYYKDNVFRVASHLLEFAVDQRPQTGVLRGFREPRLCGLVPAAGRVRVQGT
jgi:hypothetical protein